MLANHKNVRMRELYKRFIKTWESSLNQKFYRGGYLKPPTPLPYPPKLMYDRAADAKVGIGYIVSLSYRYQLSTTFATTEGPRLKTDLNSLFK